MADCACLESKITERLRGFESHSLLQFQVPMRYRKENLVGRKWHKIVTHHTRDVDIELLKSRIEGEYMCQSGGHWHLLMIERDEDLILAKLLLYLREEDYRGYGAWDKKKYSSAATNRIVRGEQ